MVARAVTVFHHEEQGASCHPNPSPPPWDPAQELCCVTTNLQYLQTSGWYWGSISAHEARNALLTKAEGTFLIRDSSHPQYMLALSVKTSCGPTSIRIEYQRGSFWLDSISPRASHLPAFPDVLSLIQHYADSDIRSPDKYGIQHKSNPDPAQSTAKDDGVPLKLKLPLHKPKAFPSLQHLTRLTINRHTNCPDQLPLPKPLLHYLQDYPFHIWGSLSLRTQRHKHGWGSHSMTIHTTQQRTVQMENHYHVAITFLNISGPDHSQSSHAVGLHKVIILSNNFIWRFKGLCVICSKLVATNWTHPHKNNIANFLTTGKTQCKLMLLYIHWYLRPRGIFVVNEFFSISHFQVIYYHIYYCSP